MAAWKHSAIVVILSSAVLALIAGLVSEKFEPVLASPLSNKVYVTEEVIVEKTVHELPQTPEEIITAVFKNDAAMAIKVAKCESGLNPDARNRKSSARGLFQIMQSWHKIDQKWLFDPMINTLVAKSLFDTQGWEPWRASNHCHGGLK